jgi:hypothetical protein
MTRFVKRWTSLSEAMGWDGPPDSSAIERVLKIVRPGKRQEDCRRDIIDSIRMITKLKPDVAPPGAMRKQLREIASTLKKVRHAINKLSSVWRQRLNLDDFLIELTRVHQTSDDLADKMNVRRSGGDPSKRTAAAQKLIAAERAFDILNDWGHRQPSLTKNGDYYQLTSVLFEIATGRRSGDVERACTTVLENLQKDGFPDAAERRRLRREGKSSWKTAPKWLQEQMKADSPQTVKK